MGGRGVGYGPRYPLVDALAGLALWLALGAWALALVRSARPAVAGPDARAIGVRVVVVAIVLVLVGVALELLRTRGILPWAG